MARILCVDDDGVLSGFAECVGVGHAVDLVADGATGLRLMRQQEYDVVISDVGIPHVDGPTMLASAPPHVCERTPRVLEAQSPQLELGMSLLEEGIIDDILCLQAHPAEWKRLLERTLRWREALLLGWTHRARANPEGGARTSKRESPDAQTGTPFSRRETSFFTTGELRPLSIPRRADRPRVEAALRAYYKALMPTLQPCFTWCDSPLDGCRVVALSLPGQDDCSRLRDWILAIPFGMGGWSDVTSEVTGRLYEKIAELPDRWAAPAFLAALYGTDAQHPGLATGAARTNASDPARRLLDILLQDVGWFWVFDDGFAVLTEPHGAAHRLPDGGLHHPSEASVLYPDGFGVWALEGIRVSQEVVESPRTVPVSLIKRTRNAELRRLLRERYGESRFIEALAARLLDVDTVPVDAAVPGGPFITRALIEDDEGDRFLVASDGSTRRVYHMQVPSTCNTCREGYVALSGRSDVRTIMEACGGYGGGTEPGGTEPGQ